MRVARSVATSVGVGALLVLALVQCACGGGSGPTSPVNPATSQRDNWSTLAPMSEARQEVGVAELGGRIYVAGGFRVGGARTTTLEIYDPGIYLPGGATLQGLGAFATHEVFTAATGRTCE